MHLIALRVGECPAVEQDEFHLHAGFIKVCPQQLGLLDRFAPPGNDFRCFQPNPELRKIARGDRSECVGRAQRVSASMSACMRSLYSSDQ